MSGLAPTHHLKGTTTVDANELLMGGGIKSVSWKDNPIGYTILGAITETPKVEQMKKFQSDELDFWPSGDPKMQIIVTLQTDQRDPANEHDDGKRRLHIPPRMMGTVREAIQRVGAKGLEIGGRLAVRRIGGSGQTGDPFTFAAEYAAPAIDPGGLLNGNSNGATQAAQAAPMLTQPATPAAPVVQGSLLSGTAAPVGPPPGVEPAVWAALPDMQKAAVLAAMAPAGQPGY